MMRLDSAEPVALAGRTAERLEHVAFRVRYGDTGIGAAVVTARYEGEQRCWDCIVGDLDEWHYVQVIGIDLGPFTAVPPEDIEDGIERFGAALPAADRLHQLINFSPLHVDRHRTVGD
jgi:hypothetical protein